MNLNQNMINLVQQLGALLQDDQGEGYYSNVDRQPGRVQRGESLSSQATTSTSNTISSCGGESLSSDQDDSFTSKNITSIEQIFQWKERVAKLMEEGQSDIAYELIKKQYKNGAKVHFSPLLVKYYVTLMKTDRGDKATKVRNELMNLLNQNLDVPAEEVEQFGRSRMANGGDEFEAFLFYQIAVQFCENETNMTDAINTLHRCCARTSALVSDLIESRKVSKQLVKSYMIPFMRKICSRIGRLAYTDKKKISYVQGVCLHYIEQCEYAVNDLEARQATLEQAISTFRDNMGKEAESRHVYGGCLNNLGHTYLLKEKPHEAAKLFAQAIAVKQKATDYDTITEKNKDVEKSKMALELARKQC